MTQDNFKIGLRLFPQEGYTQMITDMLSNKRIKVMLGTNFMDISHVEGGKVIF